MKNNANSNVLQAYIKTEDISMLDVHTITHTTQQDPSAELPKSYWKMDYI